MTEADDHANRLWELLGELEARPEGLKRARPGGYFVIKTHAVPWSKVDDSIALGLLCNAARRVCDRAGIDFRPTAGEYYIGYRNSAMIFGHEVNMEYAESLATGLEWIIEQRKPSNPES